MDDQQHLGNDQNQNPVMPMPADDDAADVSANGADMNGGAAPAGDPVDDQADAMPVAPVDGTEPETEADPAV